MTDTQKAENEQSPSSTEEQPTPVKPTETVEKPNVEESTTEVVKEESETTEDNIKNKADSQETPEGETQPPTEEKKPNKTERRFQKLFGQIKDKDSQLAEYKKEEPNIELKVEKDADGNNIIDPNNLVQVAEDRAYKRAMSTINERNMIEANQRKAGDFLTDAETMADEIKKNPGLEKMASKMFEAENYVINPATGKMVFVPRKKLSVIVKELKSYMGEYSTQAQANMQTNLSQQAEESAIRPSESGGESNELSESQRTEMLRKDPNKLNKHLRKKLTYAN